MAYKGRYQPARPEKYRGDPRNIVYRSLWERRVMVEFDTNDNVLEWASEEIQIPYVSPIDGKRHRYFPDFVVKMRDRDGKVIVKMIEVKPLAQTIILSFIELEPAMRSAMPFTNDIINRSVAFYTLGGLAKSGLNAGQAIGRAAGFG